MYCMFIMKIVKFAFLRYENSSEYFSFALILFCFIFHWREWVIPWTDCFLTTGIELLFPLDRRSRSRRDESHGNTSSLNFHSDQIECYLFEKNKVLWIVSFFSSEWKNFYLVILGVIFGSSPAFSVEIWQPVPLPALFFLAVFRRTNLVYFQS